MSLGEGAIRTTKLSYFVGIEILNLLQNLRSYCFPLRKCDEPFRIEPLFYQCSDVSTLLITDVLDPTH